MSKTILLVEDNKDVVDAISSVLELEGYSVETASNGREGIEALERMDENACVILLDMMMPVLDGWGFLNFQRSRTEYSSIPVVIVSAFSEIAKSAAPNAFIPKPVKLDLLLETVKKYCA